MYGRVFIFEVASGVNNLVSTTFQKPFLCFAEQLQVLKARGLRVTDDTAAMTTYVVLVINA